MLDAPSAARSGVIPLSIDSIYGNIDGGRESLPCVIVADAFLVLTVETSAFAYSESRA